jgi:aspartyl aminopeptidase
MNMLSDKLLTFLESSPDCYHAVDSVRKILDGKGYIALSESEPWNLSDGGRYYVIRNQASIIAFRYKQKFRGFMIGASHSDAPALKIKENPEMYGDGYTRLNVEKYGGAILSGWLDRPLSVAGRILVREKEKIVSKLIMLDEDLLVIPSLAIHMNRKVNDAQSWNVQQDLLPVLSLGKTDFMELVAERAGVKKDEILGHDLFLYVHENGRVIGADKNLVLAPHLDDLQCGFGNLHGFLPGGGRKQGSYPGPGHFR